MAKNKTEAIITLNGNQPKQVLEMLHNNAAKIAEDIAKAGEEMKHLDPKTERYKELAQYIKDAKKNYDLLASAQVKDIDATERLKSAVDNLSNTSLKNLRKALGDGKRQIEGLSGAELEEANNLRALMKTVGDQVRLLEGKYVKIREGLADINHQSDQWLSKAITQQTELMDATRRGTAEYREQERVMQMLTAEQNRRNAAIRAEADAKKQAAFRQQVSSSRQMLSSVDTMKGYSQTEIQSAINTLKQAQGQAGMGGSEWKQLGDEIAQAEERFASLAGKVKEVKETMSKADAEHIITFMDSHTEGEIREAINALKLLQAETNVGGEEWKKYAVTIADAEEELAKLTGRAKEVKEELSLTEVNGRMKQLGDQSEQSLQDMLKVLQQAKSSVEPFSKQWDELAAKIDSVKARITEVATNSPFERNYNTAQKMARQDVLNDREGNLRSATKNDLEWSKDYLQKELGNTSPLETQKINEIKEALSMLDERLGVFKDNADKSAMSAEKLNEVLGNMKTASLDDLKAASVELNKQLGKLPPSGDAAKQIKAQLAALDKEIKQVEDDVVDVNDVIARSKNGKASIEELKKAYQQLQAELNKINTGDADFKNKQKALKDLKKNIDDVTGAAHKQGGAWQTAAKNLVAYVGLFGVFNQLKDMITGVISKNFQMSDSLADIRKVSGLLSKDIDRMAVSLSKIDTRTPISELNQIAYAGAKLGIGDYGAEALESFVRASNEVNVALKEDLGEEALTSLSKITEVMGLIPKLGVEQSMLKTGSAIFKLASTTTATSNKIVDFSNRILAMGKTGALTTSDILALGAAVDSMAMEPEVASTAFNLMITKMRQGTGLLEKDLGLAKDTLKNLLEQGKGMEAIQTVFHRMHDTKNVFAMNDLFKDMGSEGSRLIKVMVTMADKVDMLDKAVATSNQAFIDGTAVTKEYQIQQETAQGILARANNLWNKAFVNPDGVNLVKELALSWYELSRALTQSSVAQKSVMVTLDIIITSCKTLIELLPGIVGWLAGQAIVRATASIAGITRAIWAWVTAQKALNLAMKSNIIGAVVGGLAMLYTWFTKDANAAKDAADSTDKFTMSLRDAMGDVSRARIELDGYKRAIEQAKEGTKERQAAINNFNNKFGKYLSKLVTEKNAVNQLAIAYTEAAQAIEKKVMAEARSKDIKQHVEPKGYRSGQLKDDYDQYMKSIGLGQFNGEWLMSFANDQIRKHGTNNAVRELIRRSGVASGLQGAQRTALINALYNTNGKSGSGYSWKSVSKGVYGEKHIDTNSNTYTKAQRGVAMGIAYLRQYGAQIKSEQDVIRKYKDYHLDDNPDSGNDGVGVGGNNFGSGSGGGKIGHTNKGGNTDNQEKKLAETRANALIANIKAFYEEQKRKYLEWVTQMNADGEKISEGQQKQMIDYLDTRVQTILGTAKKSIATLDDGWDRIKQTIDEDVMVFDDDTSKELLESIGKSDIKGLHELFEKLSGDLSRENNKSLSENLGALLDQIFANGTAAMREAAEKLIAHQREIQKILNENDYTGAVDRNTRSNFDTIGFLHPAKEVNSDTKEGLEQMNKSFDALTKKVRSTVSELYELNPASGSFRESFLDYLSVANDGFDFSVLKTQELKALYLELIKYTDSYTEAEKRKYDKAKKIADQAWADNKRNLANQEKLRKMQQESSLFGKRTNLLSNLGLADLTADPEMELMRMKMQMAEDYYAFVEKNSQNMQLIREADRAREEAELAYANQMASAMKERLSQMQSLVQPIVTFGGEVGKAFAEMRNDVSSAQEAIKNALKSMLEAWGNMALNDVNTQMWKAINDAGAKRAQKKAQPGINAARANAEANASAIVKENLTDIGTKSNPMYVRLVEEGAEHLTEQPQTNFENMPTQQPIGWNPDGSPIMPPYAPTDAQGNPITNQGATGQQENVPRAWAKRNRDNVSAVYEGAGDIAGSAIADAATGNGSSFADVAAGIGGSVIGGLMNQEFTVGGNGSNSSAGATASTNAGNNTNGGDKTDKEQKKQLKKEKKHQQELTKEVKKGAKDRSNETNKGMKDIVQATEDGNNEQRKGTEITNKAMLTGVDTLMNQTFTLKQQGNQEQAQADADLAQTQMTFSIAGAIGKCFQFLGPIAGPIAAAVVMSTLTGLMQWALNSAFGSKKKSSSSTTNTKLVTGMLTYDSGNVQDLKPFVANNGEVYWAKEDDAPKQSGVQMLNTPTATTINGQPSLVAEKGPEIVIGRETTHAMMMNNPQLLKALVNYDSNYSGRNSARRAFDNGNVADTLAASLQASNGNLSPGASATGDMIAANAASNAALLQAVNALLERLSQPISAKIDMYGRGNLYDSMNKANQFMKGKS